MKKAMIILFSLLVSYTIMTSCSTLTPDNVKAGVELIKNLTKGKDTTFVKFPTAVIKIKKQNFLERLFFSNDDITVNNEFYNIDVKLTKDKYYFTVNVKPIQLSNQIIYFDSYSFNIKANESRKFFTLKNKNNKKIIVQIDNEKEYLIVKIQKLTEPIEK